LAVGEADVVVGEVGIARGNDDGVVVAGVASMSGLLGLESTVERHLQGSIVVVEVVVLLVEGVVMEPSQMTVMQKVGKWGYHACWTSDLLEQEVGE